MAQVVIDVPAAITPRLLAAVEARLGERNAQGSLILSGAPLVKKVLVDFLRCHLRDYEVMLEEAAAHKTAFDKATVDGSSIS